MMTGNYINYIEFMLILTESNHTALADQLYTDDKKFYPYTLPNMKKGGGVDLELANWICEKVGWKYSPNENPDFNKYTVPKGTTLKKVVTLWLLSQEPVKNFSNQAFADIISPSLKTNIINQYTVTSYKNRGFPLEAVEVMVSELGLDKPSNESLLVEYLSKAYNQEDELIGGVTLSGDTLSIPITTLQPSAGLGTGIIDLIKSEIMESVKINREWLLTQFPNINLSKPLGLCKIRGDSMVPAFNPSDTVLVEQCQSFSEDGVYVFEAESNLYIKRVQKVPFAGCKIISDNEAYDVLELNNEQITKINVLAKVIGCYSFKKVA